MTDHASSRAARVPRTRDESAPRDGRQRTQRQRITDADLAELEALLAGELQNSESPSIAANDDDGEQSAPSGNAAPVRRKKPPMPRTASRTAEQPRRARRAPPRADNHNDQLPNEPEPRAWMRAFEAEPVQHEEPAIAPGHPVDLDQYAPPRKAVRPRRPAPSFPKADDRAPLYAKPRNDQDALVSRALRIGATVFSLLALVGVSALLVLLVIGGERSAPSKQATVAATSTTPLAAESTDAPVVTGSTATLEARRTSEGQPAARGIVRAADAQDATVRAPRQPDRVPETGAPTTLAAAPAQQPESPRPAANRSSDLSPFSPPPAMPASAAPEETAANAAADRAAGDRAAVSPARASAAPAASTRSVPVTSHVNLRATADNGAAVVAVVPAGKNVEVVDCKGWCEVVYNDQRGFVHKRFLKE